MGRIGGHYEWDDDDLTSARKREGGLHQNLFDKDGHLKGHARFIPLAGDEDKPLVITETVYIPIEQRRRTIEEEAFQQAIADLVSVLIDQGIAKASRTRSSCGARPPGHRRSAQQGPVSTGSSLAREGATGCCHR